MSTATTFPRSPKDEIDGIPYFPRMVDKIRKFAAGELHEDYHKNLGKALDLWTCQLLKIEYSELVDFVQGGATDEEALAWSFEKGGKPEATVKEWWCSYARNRGFRDDLSEKLELRKAEAGMADRHDICSFFDFMDAEEGR
ncbi:protein of unknown function [Rubritalea squalenifaciens DSM 18772]|uniref:DUF5069 domain-containing protein n=2 Tax=Rubritalea TaxID=361050 RepID=A0A1M6GSG8_9BACT|nr:DUF5069 domain-containing protein [Rubritalea squalenifaciens]SHJ12806.1 protein of unknown function [Rubritalea squalenifaciens DSM 18772]